MWCTKNKIKLKYFHFLLSQIALHLSSESRAATVLIDVLEHISIILQDVKSEIKTEIDECEDIDDAARNLFASDMKEEVRKCLTIDFGKTAE